MLVDEILRACQQPAHPTASRNWCGAVVASWSSCPMPSTPSPSWRSPSIAAAPRLRRWSPNAVSRSPRPPVGWTRRFAPTTAADRWLSECAPSTTRFPGIGHACGHNIIAASAVGTALALAEVADDLGLTVALLGTPAEESGGGKALMLQAGTFDDVAVAVMVHPGPTDIAGARSLALSEVTVRYRGKESHAAVAPHLGVNAADAVTVAQVAIGVLRQQLAPGQMVHGIVTDGGQAVNVIPGQARLQYAMRAVESDSLRELQTRMFACFAAGALAAGCEYEIDEAAPAYAELKPDPWLADVCREEMQRLGREPLLPALEAELPLGSTDMGNVTQVLPGIHPVIGLDAGAATVHQRAFTVASAGASADRAVVDGAIMLARTVVRLAQTPDERDRVLAAQQRRAAR
ncbi:hydrolase [Mycobacterium tuberculosis T85]|nr:hydrolase [Mycobacterium tuberculosis T85]